MGSAQDDDQRVQEQAREAFFAGMKTRLEQAQASGKSPEQIRQQIMYNCAASRSEGSPGWQRGYTMHSNHSHFMVYSVVTFR